MAQRCARWCDGDADALEGPQITEAARDGDPLSIELLADVGRWLGVGLAGMAAAFDPGCIIIGGGLSDAGELLIDPTRQAFSRSLTGRGHRDEPVIVRAELGPERRLHRRRRHGALGRPAFASRTRPRVPPRRCGHVVDSSSDRANRVGVARCAS